MAPTWRPTTGTGLDIVVATTISLEDAHDGQGWGTQPPTVYRLGERPGGGFVTARHPLGGWSGRSPEESIKLLADLEYDTPLAAYALVAEDPRHIAGHVRRAVGVAGDRQYVVYREGSDPPVYAEVHRRNPADRGWWSRNLFRALADLHDEMV